LETVNLDTDQYLFRLFENIVGVQFFKPQ